MSRTSSFPPWIRRVGIEVLGWLLIVLGLAALVLPGPGLLTLAVGLIVLSLRYAWAKRLLIPIRKKALDLAARSVQASRRIIGSVLGAVILCAIGIVWGVRPPAPSWWKWPETWWLPGGWGPGSTLIASGLIALALIIYSYRRFRTNPTQV